MRLMFKMTPMNLDHVSKIYFVGIGGIAMSATAGIAKKANFDVLGSDASQLYSPSKEVLSEEAIPVFLGYKAEQIAESNADLFIISAGEDTTNPEVQWLIEKNKEFYSFPELLYELSKNSIRIVIAGTHGKSTTTGMLGHLLKNLDDSSFMTGAVLQNYDSNFYAGEGHYFVFEGDEYKSTFEDATPKMHYYKPDTLILNNLEFDHPDIYKNLEEMKSEFAELLENLPDDGIVVYNADDSAVADLVYNQNHRAFGFSIDHHSEMHASEITTKDGFTSFIVTNSLDPQNIRTEKYDISLPGTINVYNALASIATLRALGFQPESINHFLREYKGVKRRFEIVSENNGITIVDDYAHHPTAVRETIEAARHKYGPAKIWAIFEPHTYSRTKATLSNLATSFNKADEVLLAPIYGAREHNKFADIRSEDVLAEVSKNNKHTRLVADRTEAKQILKDEVKAGDIVLVMSVGTFNQLAYELKDTLQQSK